MPESVKYANGYLQDPSFKVNALSVGVILDPNTGLYWLNDEIFVPNVLT